MLTRVKKDFENGLQKVKWFSALLSERVRIEVTIFKLLYKSDELKKKKDDLLKNIGEEVYAMRGKETNVYNSKEVRAAIKSIEAIEPEIRETMDKASDISKIVS
ncbi:MAG: hypothetical protein HQL08_06010 [Nitrospirae bacterium]|nr:hypothetical protein [Nitrospirota bacterium]